MKKVILFMFLYTTVNACDICNMNISLIPEDFKNTFSLIYRSRFTSGTYTYYGTIPSTSVSRHAGPGNSETTHFGKKVTEIYNVIDARGIYYINNKISIIGSLPIINNVKYTEEVKEFDFQKTGDPIVLINYNLVNTKLTPGLKFNHRLNVGGGFKLPLGDYKMKINDKTIEPDMQPGTGSLDFILTSDYVFTIGKFGLLNNINIKLNTVNDDTYRYGSSLNHTLLFFYSQNIKVFSIMPNVGAYLEYANNDMYGGYYIPQSGGMVMLSQLGLNIYYKKIRMEGSYQYAFLNSMNGNTQLPTKNRIIMGLSYYFN